ncbi:hypothetical protein ARMGADRAFT_1078654 [Armillaria gallica]|uniref:Uncharacterized protein n=1 Tax=Armillaria gallica TaxID=47427 RepID=A0A2H3DLQ1_ARMGA|nr:hypothetical protein ARMGADRAFT_1078654 [Armillaria gallica]
MVLLTLLVLRHPMTFQVTKGQAYSTDTERIRIHTPQHLNPPPIGNKQTAQNPLIPEVKLIPLLILQIDTTRVTMDLTPNQVTQMDLEALAAPTDQEDQAYLATMFPTSKNSYENS